MNFRTVCVVAFMCAFIGSNMGLADEIFTDGKKRSIELRFVSKGTDLTEDKELFVRIFDERYKDIRPEEFRPHLELKSRRDVKEYLGTLFDLEQAGLEKGDVFYERVFHENKFIGFITFEIEPSENNAIYVRQSALKEEYRDTTLFKGLAFSILTLKPDTQAIFFATRKQTPEDKLVSFYRNIGFSESKYQNPRLEEGQYLGFEWRREN